MFSLERLHCISSAACEYKEMMNTVHFLFKRFHCFPSFLHPFRETVVEVQPGAFAQASVMTVEMFKYETAQDMNLVANVDNVVTDVVRMRKDGDGMVTIRLKNISSIPYGTPKMLVAAREGADFVEIESTFENNTIIALTNRDGIFLATSQSIGLFIGIGSAVLVIIVLVIVIILMYCVYRAKTTKKKCNVCVNLKLCKRNLQSKI